VRVFVCVCVCVCARVSLSLYIYIYIYIYIYTHTLYSSPSIIRIIKSRWMTWAGHVARMGEKINAYRLLVGKPEKKRPLGRPRRRWADNIKMDLLG
jgi:hypothetical protein